MQSYTIMNGESTIFPAQIQVMKQQLHILLFFLLPFTLIGQPTTELISGPMLGQVELRTATIWAEVKPATLVSLRYNKKGSKDSPKTLNMQTGWDDWYSPVKFKLVNLEMNTEYEYELLASVRGKNNSLAKGSFRTQELWQYRKPAPDFSFLIGSCAYFNDPEYDRPGKPYGNDSTIFQTMAKEKAAFMLWLGDNWYTREPDYHSEWGLWYRASRDRSLKILQPFLRSTTHYAIWDDHDYGPNNSNGSYHLKKESREVFKNYWANPSYGEDDEGIYTKFSYADLDVFLMDDRYFRSADELESRIDGKINEEKRMWGKKQLSWLKNALAASDAPFKIVASGSQFINTLTVFDCLVLFPVEFNELMDFLEREKIEGVVFLSGDRHHSEIVAYPRENAYTLYDITSSSLTAGVAPAHGAEKDNPNRVPNTLIEQNNYARISISGSRNQRVLKVEYVGLKGDTLASFSINEQQLKFKK